MEVAQTTATQGLALVPSNGLDEVTAHGVARLAHDIGEAKAESWKSVHNEGLRQSFDQQHLSERVSAAEKEALKAGFESRLETVKEMARIEKSLSDKIEGMERRALERQVTDTKHTELLSAILSIKA